MAFSGSYFLLVDDKTLNNQSTSETSPNLKHSEFMRGPNVWPGAQGAQQSH